MRVSGFSVPLVNGAGRGPSRFIDPRLVCMGRVFGMRVYPFLSEWDRGGEISGLLSSDGLVFTRGRFDLPPPHWIWVVLW